MTKSPVRLIVGELKGKKCWYASYGESVGASFSLALGAKVARKLELRNKAHSAIYRKNEGECNLLVWCSWRIDNLRRALSSSDDVAANRARTLDRLRGKRVISAKISAPCWDMKLSFEGGLILNIFCDHVPGDPSFDGNWEVWLRNQAVYAGPGSKLEVEKRE